MPRVLTKYAHSKGPRPDLKQMVMNLATKQLLAAKMSTRKGIPQYAVGLNFCTISRPRYKT